MSEAERFKFAGRGKNVPFPFCYAASVPAGWDYVGGLTLQQICDVWWSLEKITIETSGTYTFSGVTVDVTQSFIAPDDGVEGLGCSFVETGAGQTTAISPKDRACVDLDYAVSIDYFSTAFFTLSIRVSIDPDDDTKFSLLYRFRSYASDFAGGDVILAVIQNPEGAALETGTPEFSGTIDFGGVTINWVGGGQRNSLGWVSGGLGFDVSMTPSYFTYPPP